MNHTFTNDLFSHAVNFELYSSCSVVNIEIILNHFYKPEKNYEKSINYQFVGFLLHL